MKERDYTYNKTTKIYRVCPKCGRVGKYVRHDYPKTGEYNEDWVHIERKIAAGVYIVSINDTCSKFHRADEVQS